MSLRLLVTAAAAAILTAAPCWAQGPPPLRSPLVRADASVNGGWLAADQHNQDRYDNWYTAGYVELAGGWYWTDHLKTEIQAGWSARENRRTIVYDPRQISLEFYREVDYDVATSRVSFGQLYQFGRNAAFHPYAGGGVDLTWERFSRTEYRYISPPTRPVEIIAPHTDLHVRPFAQVGFKGYLTPRAFFRGDVKLVVHDGVDEVLTRFGFGIDF